MINLLVCIYFLPLLSCLVLCLPYRFKEQVITRITTFSILLPAITSLFLVIYEGLLGKLPLEHDAISLKMFGHLFEMVIWIDFNTVVMMALTHILGLLVMKYSHGYLHLEKGYQRFFSTILFFIFGMYVLCLAGTMDLFFAGWEIVGLSSFFLIAYYRSHTRSVLNAWRIYNIYRICDVGILLGAVLGHVFWHEATRFSEIIVLSPEAVAQIPSHYLTILGLFLVFSSIGKSAQFPFHVWPSRAMEGPTPSSAIFYGALSIHAGVFLLVRTYSIWSMSSGVNLLVGFIGIITFVLSTLQGRVQSNIKGQIAFASTAQIGIMFLELSFGFPKFAMIHLFLHALYRCFQILVSPSIVANSLTLNNQVTIDRLKKSKKWELKYLPKKFNATLYSLALNDFSLDTSWRGFGFLPWRRAYKYTQQLLANPQWVILAVIFLAPLFQWESSQTWKNTSTLALGLSSLSLFYSLRALFFHTDPFKAMIDLSVSLVMDMTSIYLINHHSLLAIQMYGISIFPALLLGLLVCKSFRKLDLHNFHGKGTAHPGKANLYLISFMVLAGMPISTAFFGEDVILEELIMHSTMMAFFTSLSLTLNGLICVKIYTRIFMGSPFNVTSGDHHGKPM